MSKAAKPRDVENNPKRESSEWTTDGEPTAGPQESQLGRLSHEADEDESAAAASDALQRPAGRGRHRAR
jgi:hypothetical protein